VDVAAYAYVGATNLFSTLYAVNINVAQAATGLDVYGLLLYNTLLTLPPLVLLAVVSGDMQRAVAFDGVSAGFLAVFGMSVALSFFLNVAGFWVTTTSGASTKVVISGLKTLGTILLGAVLFSDYHFEPVNFAGISIAFLGGIYHSAASSLKRPPKQRAGGAAVSSLKEDGEPDAPLALAVSPEPHLNSSAVGSVSSSGAAEDGWAAADPARPRDVAALELGSRFSRL